MVDMEDDGIQTSTVPGPGCGIQQFVCTIQTFYIVIGVHVYYLLLIVLPASNRCSDPHPSFSSVVVEQRKERKDERAKTANG